MKNQNEGQLPTEVQVENLRSKIMAAYQRVKELGNWPNYIGEGTFLDRIPKQGDTNASGFDAGIACALDLIPRDKQKLAATLHAAYTPEAVDQVRKELEKMDADSETVWWLAACSMCEEGGIDQKSFLDQITGFEKLAQNSGERKIAAQKEREDKMNSFRFENEIDSEVPFGERDGCISAAYIAGFPFAVNFSEKYGIYFIGTYHSSLGLENFQWSDEKDEQGRPKSGPVFGSKQFVKCATLDEVKKAIKIIKPNFSKELEEARNIMVE